MLNFGLLFNKEIFEIFLREIPWTVDADSVEEEVDDVHHAGVDVVEADGELTATVRTLGEVKGNKNDNNNKTNAK